MYDVILALRDARIVEVLFIASIFLVLIDYFFPVDYPAYIGYVCFAVAIFFVAPFALPLSLLLGVGVLAILLLLHRQFFTHYLTNATDKPEPR